MDDKKPLISTSDKRSNTETNKDVMKREKGTTAWWWTKKYLNM